MENGSEQDHLALPSRKSRDGRPGRSLGSSWQGGERFPPAPSGRL